MRISDWSSDVCSSDLGQSRSACPECGRSGAGRGCPSRHTCTCRKAAHLQPGTWHIAGHADRSCRADAGTGAGRRKMIGWLGETYLWVKAAQIGRAHVCTPVTNAHLVCRLLLETNKDKQMNNKR